MQKQINGFALTSILLSSSNFKIWMNEPETNKDSDTSWFGYKNAFIPEPGTYSPAPSAKMMLFVQNIFNQNHKKWQLTEDVYVGYNILQEWVNYLNSTDIPLPYIGYKQDIDRCLESANDFKKKNQAIYIFTPRQRLMFIHLVGCIFHICKLVFDVNKQLKRNEWMAFPPDWGRITIKHDGDYHQVQQIIRSEFPNLPMFPCPPPAIASICIKLVKNAGKRPERMNGMLGPAYTEDIKYKNDILNEPDKIRLSNYFRTTFPELSKHASSIDTQEILPYYQWQGLMVRTLIDRIQVGGISNYENYNSWKRDWPPLDRSAVHVTIKFKAYQGAVYPPFFWPVPNFTQETLLVNIASTIFNPNDAKIQLTGQMASEISSCFKPNGFMRILKIDERQEAFWKQALHKLVWISNLNQNTEDRRDITDITMETVAQLDVNDLNSNESKKALEKMLTFLYAYAISFRNHIAGRERANWAWDESGNLLNATPVDKFHTCLARQVSDFANDYFNTTPGVCLATNIPEWSEPWKLEPAQLRTMIQTVYPIPRLLSPTEKPKGQSQEEYHTLVEASKGGYEEWVKILCRNPSKLETCGIGTKIGMDKNTGLPIINMFPNYGVFKNEGQDDLSYFILNPYHSVYGKYLFDDLLRYGNLSLDFLREEFKKTAAAATDAAANAADSLLLPVVTLSATAAGLMFVYSQTLK